MDINTALTGKQKRFLRALGSEMEPVVQIGKAGVIPTVIEGARDVLAARELIKIRVQKNSPLEPREAISELAESINAEVVQVIGRNGLVYKLNTEKTKIELP